MTTTRVLTAAVVVGMLSAAATTSTILVSADGKTRTTTIKGTDVKGQPVDVVSFYEKQ